MLLSISIIILVSLLFQSLFKKLNLPGILGMLLAGILLGPHLLDLIDGKILDISAELREIALIVILIRAGLSLDLEDLKKVGRPAILLSFLPATFEIIAITIFAPMFFDIPYITAMTMGAIVAAVSPAIVVPRMIKLMEQGYGKVKKVPQMILAAASIDDVYAIIIFYAFIKYQQGGQLSAMTFINIPISILLGVIVGLLTGFLLVVFFKKIHMRDTLKVLIIFSVGFLLLSLEDVLSSVVAISGLLSVMAMAMSINRNYLQLAKRLVNKFEKIWVIAEIMLFVLVGALVDITVLIHVGLLSIALIIVSLAFRMVAVYIATSKTNLTLKERLFTAVSYTPKATVQAAIGAIPLTLGLPYGEFILMVSVLSIIITAPFGAIMMDHTYHDLLSLPKPN
ncbi:MAG: cation:proton antiporter [Acholeplasmataceae bacterium]